VPEICLDGSAGRGCSPPEPSEAAASPGLRDLRQRVALLGLVGTCNPDFNFAVIGFKTIWTPVKTLAFTADVNITQLDQKFSGTIASPGSVGVGKPAAVYELKDQTAISVLLRAQRNF
jgi:hypothetical protein